MPFALLATRTCVLKDSWWVTVRVICNAEDPRSLYLHLLPAILVGWSVALTPAALCAMRSVTSRVWKGQYYERFEEFPSWHCRRNSCQAGPACQILDDLEYHLNTIVAKDHMKDDCSDYIGLLDSFGLQTSPVGKLYIKYLIGFEEPLPHQVRTPASFAMARDPTWGALSTACWTV